MGNEHEPRPQPKRPSVALSPRDRIEDFPRHVQLDEAIVGTNHANDLVTPQVAVWGGERQDARAIVSVHPVERPYLLRNRDRERKVPQAFYPADTEHTTAKAIPIAYWPQRTGDHEADVHILLLWPDGVSESRRVHVGAHARNLDDAPASPLQEPHLEHDRAADVEPADTSGVASVHLNALDSAFEHARAKVSGLRHNYISAVNNARPHIIDFHRAPPLVPAWVPLIEIAISMAVGGIASIAGRAAAARLGPIAARLRPIEHVSKEVRDAFISDTLKDGIKAAARNPLVQNAIESVRSNPRQPPKKPDGTYSPVGSYNFCAMADEGLNAHATSLEDELVNMKARLQHALASAPDEAIATMRVIGESLREANASTTALVQRELELQWLRAVAQASGVDHVDVQGRTRSTTDLRAGNVIADGVLRMSVNEDGTPTDAAITGITRELAERLHTQSLADAPIPIAFLQDIGLARRLITRDEVGRVRSPILGAQEPQTHRELQAVVDRALSKPLASWGVKSIVTDDDPGKK